MFTNTRNVLAAALAHAVFVPCLGLAEDIDLYSGNASILTPNVLIVLDNAAAWNGDLGGGNCTYTDGGSPSLKSGSSGAAEQCALVNVVNALPMDANGAPRVNLGMMIFGRQSNQAGLLLQPIVPMNTSNKSTFTSRIKALQTPGDQGNGSQIGATMQEAYAYYTGGTGLSGTSYAGTKPVAACQNNFIIYIANTSTQGKPQDNLDAKAALSSAGATGPYLSQIAGGTQYDSNWGDEWTRFMRTVDISGAMDGKQNIITYTIAVSDPAKTNDDYVKFAANMAVQGGGKAFTAASYQDIVQAILKILNEIQAVNSVFSSSSLPVSVNTQGTYLNQVFMGMFRPDPNASPRWMGNLKQYQFKMVNGELMLGDSTSNNESAINPSTGFISPNAISYWTSFNAASDPDKSGGFWINDPKGTNANNEPNPFDSPDGEVVEKGGVSQQLRLANLKNNYTSNPTGPRKVYTYCPSGSGCQQALTNSANAFATSNAAITEAMLSAGTPIAVSSITRNLNAADSVATLVTAANHGLNTGDTASISGATQPEYNGSFTVTKVNDTTFTYTVPVTPVTPATATDFTASIPGTPLAVTALSRNYGAPFYSATATVPGHTFTVGQSITLANAQYTEYNNSVVVTSVSGNNVTFTVAKESPQYQGGGGTAKIGSATYTIAPASSGIQRGATAAGGAGTRVIATVTSNLGNSVSAGNTVTISGALPTAYNGTFSIVGVGTSCTAINTTAAGGTVTVTGTNKRSICFDLPSSVLSPPLTSGSNGTTTADGGTSPIGINLTRTGTTATATVKSGTHPFTVGQTVNIGGTPGAGENGYVGSVNVTAVSADKTQFSYTVTTSPSSPATGNIKVSVAGSVDRDDLINWIRGEDNVGDEPSPDKNKFNIRPSVHGDVLHSRPVVINYGGTTGIVAFYGANDGVFRAVNGNQSEAIASVPAGGELWGFIPAEFYGKLARLSANTPDLKFPSTPNGITPTPQPKDYFVDGPTGVYQKLNPDGTTREAIIYLSMRRGGRLIYAIDVTSPTDPKVLWKKDPTSLGTELGYTWSQPKVALVKGYGNGTSPVLIFGAGYDTAQDTEPPGVDTMGRGIFILDAITGDLVWSARSGASTSCATASPFGCEVASMKYSIPADLSLVDRDGDGKIERLYGVDVGGNIWRVDLETTSGATPGNWRVSKLAALGCDNGECSSGSTPRKFLYPPDVVPVGRAGATDSFDAVLLGSGDREHPLYSTAINSAYNVRNRFFMVKDLNTSKTGTPQTTVTQDNLVDVSNGEYDGTKTGYYFTFGTGEQSVNASLTVAGFTYFGTNQPKPKAVNECSDDLGVARGYKVRTLLGTRSYTVFQGGGLPPSPVAGLVNIKVNGVNKQVPFAIGTGNPDCTSADCKSALGGVRPPIDVSTKRTRTYWYNK